MQPNLKTLPKPSPFFAEFGRAWLRLPVEWRDSLAVVLIGRIFYSVWGVLIWRMGIISDAVMKYYYEVKPVTEGAAGALLGMWQRWDGVHYQRIATGGYFTDTLSAFLPAYPFLGTLFQKLTGMHILLALILVGNVAFLLSLVLLHKIVQEHFSLPVARGTILTLALFPSSFYFFAISPMSLVLLLILASYWLAHQRRWFWAALVGLAAGLTHTTALPLSILVGYEVFLFIRQEKSKLRWVTLLVPLCSFLGYGLFAAWRLVSIATPFSEIYASYGRSFSWPWNTLSASFLFIFTEPFKIITPFEIINLLILLLSIYMGIVSIRKMPLPFLAYQAVLTVILISSISVGIPLLSFMRYALILFPMFIEIELLNKSPKAKLIMLTTFMIFNLILTFFFLSWNGAVA